MNYYLILGIDSKASITEIKEAYRKLVLKYHPDHFGDDSSRFLRIQEAYQVLMDPVSRKRYDQSLPEQKSRVKPTRHNINNRYSGKTEPLIPPKRRTQWDPISLSRSFDSYSPSFEEIFDRLFVNFDQGIRQKSGRTTNLKVEVTISSEEAARGGSLQLFVPVQMPCPLCYGTGNVGFWDCHRCNSQGIIDTEIPLIVSYPAGIQKRYHKRFALDRYGIDNYYLTVIISVN